MSGTLTFSIDGEWSYGVSYTDIFRGWSASDISNVWVSHLEWFNIIIGRYVYVLSELFGQDQINK